MQKVLMAIAGGLLVAELTTVPATATCQTGGDARSRGAAGIISFPEDRYAAGNNPAHILSYKGMTAAIECNNRYLLKEMKDINLIISYQNRQQGFGVSLAAAGMGLYLRQSYSLSYARSFGERIRSGVSLVYICFKSQEDARSLHAGTFKLGLDIALTDRVHVSFCGINPAGLAIASRGSGITPQYYLVGLSYQPASSLTAAAEIQASSETGWSLKAGLEYSFKERFFLRAGCMSDPFRFTFGTGFSKRRLIIDLAMEYHAYLGFSPAVSIAWHFINNADE